MNSIVEYIGLANELPAKIEAYKQFCITKKIILDKNRMGIKDIIKVSCESYITNRRIIKTAEGTSLEGERLTGLKYLLKGSIDLRVYYEEESAAGLLGVNNISLKFYEGIVLEKEFMSNDDFIPNIYIEDIYSETLNNREFLVAVTATAIVEGDNQYE